MPARFDYGEAVRVTRSVRNDGTYPGAAMGTLLVRRGAVGYIRNVGTFLQDEIIYAVHFPDTGRLVGCREEELIRADAPWTPCRFDFHDPVVARVPLALRGEVVVAAEEPGQVLKLLPEASGGVAYHVYFSGRVLQVPDTALAAPDCP